MLTMTLIINSVLLGVGLAMDAFSVSLANGLNEHQMGTGRMLGIAGTFAGFQFAMPMIGWVCVHAAAQKFEAFQKYIPWIALALLLYIGGSMLIEGIKDTKAAKPDVASRGCNNDGSDDTASRGGNNDGSDDAASRDGNNEGSDAEDAGTCADDAGSTGVGVVAGADDANTASVGEVGGATQPIKRLALGALMVQGVATSIDALSVGFTIAEYNTAEALASSLIIGVVTYAICMAGLALGKKFGTRLAGKASILGGVILIGIGVEIFVTGVFL